MLLLICYILGKYLVHGKCLCLDVILPLHVVLLQMVSLLV